MQNECMNLYDVVAQIKQFNIDPVSSSPINIHYGLSKVIRTTASSTIADHGRRYGRCSTMAVTNSIQQKQSQKYYHTLHIQSTHTTKKKKNVFYLCARSTWTCSFQSPNNNCMCIEYIQDSYICIYVLHLCLCMTPTLHHAVLFYLCVFRPSLINCLYIQFNFQQKWNSNQIDVVNLSVLLRIKRTFYVLHPATEWEPLLRSIKDHFIFYTYNTITFCSHTIHIYNICV